MRFLTHMEAAEWAGGHSMLMPFGDHPDRQPRLRPLRFALPQPAHRLYALSSSIAARITPGDSCLLWITEFGVWPSNENMHLYYRLRESYGDRRLMHEAPAHLCLQHETADLITLLQLTLLFGWDAYLLPRSDHLAVFCSHDEFIECYSRNSDQLAEFKIILSKMDITFEP